MEKITLFLELLGIKYVLFISGIAGGVVSLDKRKQLNWFEKFTAVLSGGFAANYLTPLITSWLSFTDDVRYGIGFIIGYGGLKLVELVYLRFEKKIKSNEPS